MDFSYLLFFIHRHAAFLPVIDPPPALHTQSPLNIIICTQLDSAVKASEKESSSSAVGSNATDDSAQSQREKDLENILKNAMAQIQVKFVCSSVVNILQIRYASLFSFLHE
jgi:uncharacterized protein (DUF302 family)